MQKLKGNKASRLFRTSLIALLVLSVALLFAIPNPVTRRFYDVVRGDIGVVTKESFKPGDYFNGLQFRLLQWRFVPEILTENGRWWIGVSPGDGQTYLDEKYLSLNMYAGDPAKGTRGYLVYNTHNQFLQSLLQNGVIGLVILIATCICLLKMVIVQKSRLVIFVAIALLTMLFTESPFETQYGIMIFTFFPMLLTSTGLFSGSFEKPAS
jgi:O-antigen ligase